MDTKHVSRDSEARDEARELCARVILKLAEQLESLLATARKHVAESVEDFVVKRKIGCLWPAVAHYSAAFKSLGVTSKEATERIARQHFSDGKVREAFDDLLQIEGEWDSLLKDVDKSINKDGNDLTEIKEGDQGPLNIDLVNADFEAANTKVVVVSFGVQRGAELWLEETKCEFDMLLDPERQVYNSIGLRRSVIKTWGIKALVYYAEAKASGKAIPQAHHGIEDDPLQMGGDFVMDKDGKMTFIYCSKVSNDRPTIASLLTHLQGLSVR